MINIIHQNNQINKFISRNYKHNTKIYSLSSLNLKTCKSQNSNDINFDKYFQSTIRKKNKTKEKIIINNKSSKNNEEYEILDYKYKQLQRDYLLLEYENKNFQNEIKKLHIDINEKKEKEIKIMKILFKLCKTFKINIDDYLEKENDYNNLDNSKSSSDSEFLYNSIRLNKKKLIKPNNVPKLDLFRINCIDNK